MRARDIRFSGVIPGLIARNRHEVDGDTVRIFLDHKDREVTVLIDKEDAALVLGAAGKWCKSNGYAIARIPSQNNRLLLMHRLITNAPPHLLIDHIDANRLDNRRQNLRVVTRSENAQNSTVVLAKSGFRNVYSMRPGFWTVQIRIGSNCKFIGEFSSKEAAAEAARLARIKYHSHSPENSGRVVAP